MTKAETFLLMIAVAVLAFATTLGVVGIAHADAFGDDFDLYSVGLVEGGAGGSGFTGNWTLLSGSGNNVTDTQFVSSPNSMDVNANGSYRNFTSTADLDLTWQMKLPSGAHPYIAFDDGTYGHGCYLELNIGYTFLNSESGVPSTWTADIWQEWHVYTSAGRCYVEIDGTPVVDSPIASGVSFTRMAWLWGGTATDYYVDDIANGDVVPPDPILGCTNPLATNYDPLANADDGSCLVVGVEATSSIDQTQQNFALSIFLMLGFMFFSIYLFKKS